MRPIFRKEIWYWPEKDKLLHVLKVGPGKWLMFFSEDRYYYYAVSKIRARRNGIIFLGSAK